MKRGEKAAFAAGCFWCVEPIFRKESGVLDAACGYMGGRVANPTYEMVCSHTTGHAEVVQVEYDPSLVSYERLLEIFWANHDPTTLNRQGPDVGDQYRSAVFYYGANQRSAAEAMKKKLDDSGRYANPIVTEIAPAAEFYRAEEYHQRYYEKLLG